MLVKDILKERGIFNDETKVISCPSCGCNSIYDNNTFIPHDSDCAFLKACLILNINPHDYNDERVLRELEVKNMFNPNLRRNKENGTINI